MALIYNPHLVVFDEPTSGLDPISRRKLLHYLKNSEGLASIIITHRTDEAEEFCDKVAILNEGKILEYGTPNELKSKHGSGYVLKIESGNVPQEREESVILNTYERISVPHNSFRYKHQTSNVYHSSAIMTST